MSRSLIIPIVLMSVSGFHVKSRWKSSSVQCVAHHPMLKNSRIVMEDKAPLPRVAMAYSAAGLATSVGWTAYAALELQLRILSCALTPDFECSRPHSCSLVALSSHPNVAAACGLRHTVLTIAQALAMPLPMCVAVTVTLRSAALVGWQRLQSATYRRLNLGLALASVWMAAASINMPAFACGYDLYPTALKLLATAAHGLTAILCTGVWVRTVEPTTSGHYVPRIVRGLSGSLASILPKEVSDSPDGGAGRDGRAEYALCAALFTWFAVLPVVSAFPLATVPALLGRRMSRAYSGWVRR